MKKYFLFFVLFIGFIPSYGKKEGQPLIDSLLQVLGSDKHRNKEDTNKASILNDLSFAFFNINPNEGIKYGEAALKMAQRLNWQYGIANANERLGNNYEMVSDYAQVLTCELKALKVYEDINDKGGIANITGSIGTVYYRLKQYDKALTYDSASLNMAKVIRDTGLMSVKISNLGNIFGAMGNFPKSLACFNTVLKMDENRHDDIQIANDLGNIGNAYEDHNEFSKGLEYNFKALEIYKKIDDKSDIGICLGDIGIAYEEIANGKDSFVKPVNMADRSAYLRKACDLLSQAIVIAKEINDQSEIMSFSDFLSKAFVLSGNYKEALTVYQQYATYKDSIFSNDNRLKIAGQETKREQDLKEKQIQINKLEETKKKNERIFFVAGLVILALIIAAVYKNYQTQKIAKEKQQTTNKLLEDALVQKDLLMKEIHHRVKNNLQVISTLLDTELTNISDEQAKGVMTESTTRVRSISLIHQQLYQNENITTIEFSQFARDLLHQVRSVFNKSGQEIILKNNIPTTILDIDTAVPLGLILNELMTNSYKYAFTNAAKGTIEISLQKKDDHYELMYKDSGQGLPRNMNILTLKSIGMQLIRNLSKQIGGSSIYSDTDKTFIITFKDEAGRQLTD